MKLKLIDFGSGAFYQSGPFTDFDGKLHFIPAYCTFYMQLRFWPSSKQTFQCTLFKEEKNYLFVMQQMKKRFCLMVFCCCKNMTQNLLQLREQNLLACFFFLLLRFIEWQNIPQDLPNLTRIVPIKSVKPLIAWYLLPIHRVY